MCSKSFQSSPTVQPHRLKPSRLLCPWDSPGKNTGMGCHSLLQGVFPKGIQLVSLMSNPHWQAGSFTTSTTMEALINIKGEQKVNKGNSSTKLNPPNKAKFSTVPQRILFQSQHALFSNLSSDKLYTLQPQRLALCKVSQGLQ